MEWIELTENNIPANEVFCFGFQGEYHYGYIGKTNYGFECESESEVLTRVTHFAIPAPPADENKSLSYILSLLQNESERKGKLLHYVINRLQAIIDDDKLDTGIRNYCQITLDHIKESNDQLPEPPKQ